MNLIMRGLQTILSMLPGDLLQPLGHMELTGDETESAV